MMMMMIMICNDEDDDDDDDDDEWRSQVAGEARAPSPPAQVSEPDSWDGTEQGVISGDESLSAAEILFNLEMCDVVKGNIVAFGYKEADGEDGDWKVALAVVKVGRVSNETFTLHYLEPRVEGEVGGRYKEAYTQSGNNQDKVVQWKGNGR
jgi:hypothetical protein